MAKSQPKIALSESRDIPFNRLVLSQSNVRRIKAGVAIEELAEDIARRTLLQSLTVRPVLDESGAETGQAEGHQSDTGEVEDAGDRVRHPGQGAVGRGDHDELENPGESAGGEECG